MRLGPSIQDWLLGFMSAGFTLCGLLVLLKGERAGFAVVAFFGGCTAVAVWMIVRKLRIRAHASASQVKMRGFVPLHVRRSGVIAWTACTSAIGIAMWTSGSAIDAGIVWIGAGLAVLGAALSVLIALGVFVHAFLQFEPAGLRLGQKRYSFLLEWDNLVEVFPGEIHGNDLLLINVRDVARLCATLQSTSTSSERLAKRIRSNRQWFGADVVIMPLQYGTDIAILAHAIKRYVADPDSRDELLVR